MASGYIPLPRPEIRNAMVDFSPLNQAVTGLREAGNQNAMFQYRQSQDRLQNTRADAQLGMQQQAAQRQQRQFDAEQEKQALHKLAGIYQHIEAAPEAERQALYQRFQPVYDRMRPRFKEFDDDLRAGGYDPSDFSAVGPFLKGAVAGWQDPLDRQYKQAQIDKLNAQASAEGTDSFGKQGAVFQDADGNQFTIQFSGNGERRILPLDGLTQARGTRVTGDMVQDVATGRDVRNVGGAIAGGERSKAIGKADGELAASMPKLEMGYRMFADKSDRLVGTIDRALGRIGPGTTGYGASLAALPATEAKALSNDLNTIRANIGFEELQAMRDASPTGGALGQVSEMENRLLQSVRAALDQYDKGENLAANLRIIRDSVTQLRSLKEQQLASDRARASSGGWRASPQTPDATTIKSKYGLE